MTKKILREGFTTGSAAAAAAKAAILHIGGGKKINKVDIPLPVGERLNIPVYKIEDLEEGVRATVIKDGGDDPDVTHKAKIRCTVRINLEGPHKVVTIEGGKGVGRVTRPGLPVPVGDPAINPVPRRQIKDAVREGLNEAGIKGNVSVLIDVVNGERIALKTFNPRLGIVGGISILGTRGTVKPYSNEAYRDTITLSMNVARKEGLRAIALSTGGRSEGFLKGQRPELPDVSFVQVADFFSFSLKEASKMGFEDIIYTCFFGKLIKMAQGHPYTHARKTRIDFDLLAQWSVSSGMDREKAMKVARANTAREALEYVKIDPNGNNIIRDITESALLSARGFAGPLPDITYYVFDSEGHLLTVQSNRGTHQ